MASAPEPPLLAPERFRFEPKLGDRDLFPSLEALVYANHAAVSPPSLAVSWAVRTLVDDYARRGVAAFPTWIAQRERLRGKLARLIGARSPSDIALVTGTSHGALDIALCFPWKRGDRVVLFEGEFPANVTPWQRAAAQFGLEVTLLPASEHQTDPEAAMARLDRELARGDVRIVAVSAVQFQTGFRMPFEAMAARAHAHGAEIFVDVAQAAGIVRIDAAGADLDYLAGGAHKWLMGLEGAGFLYVRPDRAGALRPNVAGWLSHEDAIGFLVRGPGLLRYDRALRGGPALFEFGSTAAVAFAALEAAIDLVFALGIDAIRAHVDAYLDALEPAFVERGFRSLRSAREGERSGILSVLPPAGIDVVALHRALGARGISCSIPDGHLRFSPHWPNALDEAEQIVVTLDACLADLRR